MKITYFEELEKSISDPVEFATNLVLTPLPDPKVELSIEEMEKELLELSAMHHICARMKSRGKSIPEIVRTVRKQYNYNVTATQVSYMIQKVLNLNYRMTPRSTELLRQQIDEQLDNCIAGLYASAAEEGRDYLKPADVKVFLGVLDRRIKMHGLDAPIEVKHSVEGEVRQMQDELYKKLENVMKRKNVTHIIDIPMAPKESNGDE